MYPTKTWYVDKVNNRIVNNIDGAEAYWQFVQKTLSTDKYYWYAYDKNYGVRNMQKYIGKGQAYIEARFPIDMEQALMTDDRTVKIDNYEYEEVGVGKLKCSCVIWSVYGGKPYTTEIEY